MKLYSFVFLSLLLSSFRGFAYDKFKVCLTGTTEKTIPHYGDAFSNGAILALEELSPEKRDKIEIIVDYYEPTPLAPYYKTKDLVEKKCSAIIGFSTGNDLLGVHLQTKELPILVLSIYGDPLPEFKDDPNIKTLQPGPEELLPHTLKSALGKIKGKALAITAIDRKEMVTYLEVLKRIGQNYYQSIEFETVLESDQKIDHVVKRLKEGSYDSLILFTRSSMAARIVDSLPEKRDIKIIGTKYFGSPELPAFLNFLMNKEVKAHFSRQNLMDRDLPSIKKFISSYQQKFNSSPMVISLESYNLIKYLEKVFDETKGFSPKEILAVVAKSKTNFEGIGGVQARPLKRLEHKGRYFLEITKDGYKVIK